MHLKLQLKLSNDNKIVEIYTWMMDNKKSNLKPYNGCQVI